jgi:hypothetical protein
VKEVILMTKKIIQIVNSVDINVGLVKMNFYVKSVKVNLEINLMEESVIVTMDISMIN